MDPGERVGRDGSGSRLNPARVRATGRGAAALRELLEWIRGYAEHRLNSRVMDRRQSLSPGLVLDFGNRGLLGMEVAEECGGLGLCRSEAMRVLEQLAAVDLTVGLFVGLSNALGIRPIQRFGHDETRRRWLRSLASGRELGAFALTEPGAGSNPKAMVSTARADGAGGYTISGVKQWIGNAAWAGAINVFAKTYAADGTSLGVTGFVVDRSLPGVTIGPEAPTLGMRATAQARVALDDVRVSSRDVLGEVGQGLEVAEDAILDGRLGIGAACAGAMKRCAQLMARYAARREVGTGLLIRNPVAADAIADVTLAVRAIETLYRRIAESLDGGAAVPPAVFAACKVAGSEELWRAADRLVQMLGGRGYIETNVAPQLLRDSRVLRIFEGPTDALVMHVGSVLVHAPDPLEEFLAQQLGAGRDGVGALQARLAGIREQLGARDLPAVEMRLRLRYCAGQLGIHSILAAALDRADAPTRAWVDGRLDAALAEALAFDAGGLRAEARLLEIVDSYRVDVGDVEQRLPGEDEELDAYLRREFP